MDYSNEVLKAIDYIEERPVWEAFTSVIDFIPHRVGNRQEAETRNRRQQSIWTEDDNPHV